MTGIRVFAIVLACGATFACAARGPASRITPPRQPVATLPMLLPGSPELNGERLPAGGRQLAFEIRRAGDTVFRASGRVERALARSSAGETTVLSRWAAPSATYDSLTMRDKGLVPVGEYLRIATKTISLRYDGAVVTGSVTPRDSQPRAVRYVFPQPVFAFNQLESIVRSLPWRQGYHVVVPLFSESDEAIEYDTLRVEGKVKTSTGPAWQVRFADPAIVTTYVVDEATGVIVLEEIANRRALGTLMRYRQ